MGPGDAAPSAPRRRGRGRRLLRAALAALLAAGLGFAWFLHRAALGPPDTGPSAGIAVLTGGPDRVERGLALLAAWPDSRLLVSGVGPDSGLADLARLAGADPAPIAGRTELGHGATSTRGNAREVAAWARRHGIREITVVTAGFHMPRALLELRRGLPEASLLPYPVAPFVARPVTMAREYLKLLGAALGLSALADRPRDPAAPDPAPERPAPAAS